MGSGGSVDKSVLEKDVGEIAAEQVVDLNLDELNKIADAVDAAKAKAAERHTDILGMNMYMFPGAKLVSKNGLYQAIFQGDGNFVVYKGTKVLWASNTCDSGGTRLCLQGDQHLVMYDDAWEEPKWSTGVQGGSSACRLVMQDDGNLVQYSVNDEPMWASETCGGKESPCFGEGQKLMEGGCGDDGDMKKWAKPKLGMNMGMLKDSYLVSENKEYYAVMQGDSNFVVYKADGDEALWASNTCETECDRMILQGDQHLVMYKGKITEGEAPWASGVCGKDGCTIVRLVMQDDGNLCQYNQKNEPMWCTRTDGGQQSPCMGEGEKLME